MKVTEKKFLNVHQTLSPLLPSGANGAAVSAKDLEAAKAAAVATAADKVMVSVGVFSASVGVSRSLVAEMVSLVHLLRSFVGIFPPLATGANLHNSLPINCSNSLLRRLDGNTIRCYHIAVLRNLTRQVYSLDQIGRLLLQMLYVNGHESGRGLPIAAVVAAAAVNDRDDECANRAKVHSRGNRPLPRSYPRPSLPARPSGCSVLFYLF